MSVSIIFIVLFLFSIFKTGWSFETFTLAFYLGVIVFMVLKSLRDHELTNKMKQRVRR